MALTNERKRIMASVNLNGTRFGYVECGSGEPLMFVHGAVSDYRTWQFQREEFAERFRVIAYSRRYNWPNEQIPEGGRLFNDRAG